MQADYVQRLRLIFSKSGAARYIGHLDLARTLERALNRAQIPMAYSQGFNRRPRMQMASALPLGYLSQQEMADIWLVEKMAPETARTQLMSKMAPGIDIYAVQDVDLSEPALQTQTTASRYSVLLLDPVDTAVLQQRIDALLAAASHIRERGHGKKRKEYDLRPLIYDLTLDTNSNGLAQLAMHLALLPSQTGRPDEVLYALALDPLDARICRTQIELNEA